MGPMALDLRYAIRIMRRQPLLTAVAVVTLALGIGANTAIFSVVDAVLLKPLPYPEPDRLLLLRENNVDSGPMSVGWLNFLDWKEQSRSFEAMSTQRMNGFILTGKGEPQRLLGGMVSAEFFPLLGAQPALGRFFNDQEDAAAAPRTVVLSNHLWQERFGGQAEVLGQPLMLDGAAYTIVGVAPAGLRFFRSRADLYVPVGLWGNQDAWRDRGNHQGLTVLARLQPAASLESSRVEMDTIARRLEAQYPRTNSGQSVLLQPLFETQISDVRPSLVMLVACVGLVLLITCANVANLLLSRAPARQREIALRAALGAGRRRIVRQLLTESVLLAGIGGTLGVLVASWGIEALLRIAPANIPRLDTTRLDAGVLAFTLGLSVLTGLVFGIAPALQASRADLNEGLKAGARGGTVTPAGRRLQTGLLVSEIALALAVVTGAGLMVRSILAVHDVELGFQTAKVLAVDLALPDAKYATRERRRAFFEQSLERIRALPGVQSASGVMCPPLYGSCWNSVYLAEGQAVPSQAELPVSAFNVVDPDYFKTLRVPLLEGRWFTRTDGASPVVIVNATLARRHWPGESPLGKRIKQGFPQDKTPWREIVGVVADTRQMGAEWQPGPEVYCPLSQEIDSTLTLVVRSSGDPLLQVGAVAAAIHGLDPEQPVDNIRPMTRDQAESTARRRFSTLLLGLFGALALVLAAVGIYGVNSCSVASRMHEIGVRFALGARRIDVVRLVLRRGMKPALAGVVAGLAGVTAFARLMSGLIYGVTPTDPLTVASTAGLLIVVALAACWLPALRAARIDPMIVLRLE